MGPSSARPGVLVLAAIVLPLAACQPKPQGQSEGSGSVIIGTGADADALVPPIVRSIDCESPPGLVRLA